MGSLFIDALTDSHFVSGSNNNSFPQPSCPSAPCFNATGVRLPKIRRFVIRVGPMGAECRGGGAGSGGPVVKPLLIRTGKTTFKATSSIFK
jgi:hypothetical protein